MVKCIKHFIRLKRLVVNAVKVDNKFVETESLGYKKANIISMYYQQNPY